jgi:hypothetical protein
MGDEGMGGSFKRSRVFGGFLGGLGFRFYL